MKKIAKCLSVLLALILIIQVAAPGMTSFATLLDIKEVKAYLVLNGKSNEELSQMKLKDVLGMLVDADGNSISVADDATTVWRYVKSDDDGLEEYHKYVISENPVFDLSVDADITEYMLELIVGSPYQLDKNNVQYSIKVYVGKNVTERINYELFIQGSNNERTAVKPERVVTGINNQIYEISSNQYVVPAPENGSQYYLGMSSAADEHPNIRIEIYEFWDFCINLLNATPITQYLFNQNMEQADAGLKISFNTTYMFALASFDQNDQLISLSFESFGAVNDASYIDGRLYSKEGENLVDAVLLNVDYIGFADVESIFAAKGVHELCIMLKEGYSLDSDLYCVMNAHGVTYGDAANSYVVKAVEGHFDSLDAAASCVDIKDQLIPADKESASRGYKSDYNYKNGGVPFTIFFEDGNVWQMLVLAMEYNPKYDPEYVKEFTEAPIIGEADPWIRVTGATDSSGNVYSTDNENVYIIENGKSVNMDTYYGYGYQTVFLLDEENDIDLSALNPTFWYANTERVYAVSPDTNSVVDENHVRDFTEEHQQYTGRIIDKDGTPNDRNYWVTFKKLNTNGAELFVFGPQEREVILDEYFEYKHDILIANIGNAPLEDISVELLDAENVKLDDYWTVGGEGNNTLDAFDATSSDTEYGEISNIAKIRLLPADETTGDGVVKGTLIITAKDQEPVMITLNGEFKNPEIITEEIDPAVLYVPYQHIIATDNMHDWINTEFSVEEGAESLAELGLEFDAETGELYGVPQEETTVDFTVKATFSVEEYEEYSFFEPSYAELSLVVRENTDENVYNFYVGTQQQEHYEFEDHLGEESEDGAYHFVVQQLEDNGETYYSDYTLISVGEMVYFRDLWLNGEKLELGPDYEIDDGSTKATLKDQALEKAKDGRNTIAAEFWVPSDGSEVDNSKSTAQNVYKEKKGASNDTPSTPDTPDTPDTPSAPATYKVYYNANGGTGAPGSQTKTHNVSLTLRTGKPTREGYEFTGWNTAKNGSGTSYAPGARYTRNSSVTLYAQWKALEYKVTFDANGGSGAPAIQNKVHDTDLRLSSSVPTYDGYDFVSWNTSKDGSGTNYSAGSLYKANAAVTLYAQWKVSEYKITYDANGGTGAPEAQNKIHNEPISISTVTPQREFYSFAEWNTARDGSGSSYKPGDTFKENNDTALFAQWISDSLDIKTEAVRYFGPTRYETAVDISRNTYDSADTVVLVCGEGYADALAGVPLAYAMDAPVLLVKTDEIHDFTLEEIERLGASNVCILGGEAVIGNEVRDVLKEKGYNIEGYSGETRFETAIAIAERLKQINEEPVTEIFLTHSQNYPDALSVSSIAAITGTPILYIDGSGELNENVAAFIAENNISKVTILGGSMAISTDAEINLRELGVASVDRIAGITRYETCIKINKAYASLFTGDSVCITTGQNYPDALSGGVFAAVNKSPVVLMPDSLDSVQVDYIRDRQPAVLYVFGGPNAISDDIVSAFVK